MDVVSDDARLILHQIYQHESNIRLKIDEIHNGSESPSPFPLIQQIRSKLNILNVKIVEQQSEEAEDFLRQQHHLHSDELGMLYHD